MMAGPAQDRRPGLSSAAAGLAAGAGLAVFALLVHSGGAWLAVSIGGLVLAAAVMATSVYRADRPLALFALAPVPRRAAAYVPAGLVLGAALAVLYRWHSGWTLLPQGLTGFAFVAALIGATEELIFRGYVQGHFLAGMAQFRPGGATGGLSASALVAMLAAAALHTAYKTALFALPPVGVDADLVFIATWTMIGGIAFGALRQLSGSVLAPLAAHVIFDLLAYAEFSAAPWWVWA